MKINKKLGFKENFFIFKGGGPKGGPSSKPKKKLSKEEKIDADFLKSHKLLDNFRNKINKLHEEMDNKITWTNTDIAFHVNSYEEFRKQFYKEFRTYELEVRNSLELTYYQ